MPPQIYTQTVRYVEYELPFSVYSISTPFGSGEINVNNIYLSIYPEQLAVALTAWGNIREHFGTRKLIKLFGDRYCEIRDAFIASVEIERKF